MARAPLMLVLVFCSLPAAAQDSSQVARIEQELRQVRQEVSTLSQLVTQLRAQMDRAAVPARQAGIALPPAAPGARPPVAAAGSAQWVDARRWQALRTGMGELEVVGTLGPPTSMRGQQNERVLHYAMEIGSSGVLAGSVTLRDRSVVAIEKPVLR